MNRFYKEEVFVTSCHGGLEYYVRKLSNFSDYSEYIQCEDNRSLFYIKIEIQIPVVCLAMVISSFLVIHVQTAKLSTHAHWIW